MSAFARNNGDLALTVGSNGKKNLTILQDPAQVCALKLQDRFNLWLGEWFMDVRIGVPYMQTVFRKNPDLGAVKQLFQQVIASTPPVATVNDVSLNYNPAARSLGYSFRATLQSGQVLTGGSGQPFIVTGGSNSQ